MKVTVLVDNLRNGPLKGEWGLSFLIEYEKWKILLDTGASGLFARNARRLGIDLGEVDHAVLSHAHYDHSDGMSAFFREMIMPLCISGRRQRKTATPRNGFAKSTSGSRGGN